MIKAGLDKSTKSCELTVHLVTGVRVDGTFHVSLATSSSVRPSDALRDCKDGFLILTNVTVHDSVGAREHGSVMIRAEAIAFIELPPKGWAKEAALAPGPVMATAAH